MAPGCRTRAPLTIGNLPDGPLGRPSGSRRQVDHFRAGHLVEQLGAVAEAHAAVAVRLRGAARRHTALTLTVPTSSSRQARCALACERVSTVAASPYSVWAASARAASKE